MPKRSLLELEYFIPPYKTRAPDNKYENKDFTP